MSLISCLRNMIKTNNATPNIELGTKKRNGDTEKSKKVACNIFEKLTAPTPKKINSAQINYQAADTDKSTQIVATKLPNWDLSDIFDAREALKQDPQLYWKLSKDLKEDLNLVYLALDGAPTLSIFMPNAVKEQARKYVQENNLLKFLER